MNPSELSAFIGLLLTGIGSIFVAYEVVNKFRGESHRAKNAGWNGKSDVEETEPYKEWISRRNVIMSIGLGMILFGTLLQMYSVWRAFTDKTTKSDNYSPPQTTQQ